MLAPHHRILFTGALFIITPPEKISSSVGKEINKLWDLYTEKYQSVIKSNKQWIHNNMNESQKYAKETKRERQEREREERKEKERNETDC